MGCRVIGVEFDYLSHVEKEKYDPFAHLRVDIKQFEFVEEFMWYDCVERRTVVYEVYSCIGVGAVEVFENMV